MAQSTFKERRTRSQLALPDDLLFHLPQRSPMKDARLAQRSHGQDGQGKTTPRPTQGQYIAPHEMASEPRTKRSMSPAPGSGRLERHSEPPPEREVKRAKKDHGGIAGYDAAPRKKGGSAARLGTHARNASDPSASRTRRSARKRSATPASSTCATASSGPDLPPIIERAQSVPLFPTLGSLPFIDFRNPPPSPRRARSRSPGKEGLKLVTNFEPTESDAGLGGAVERMDVEDNKSAPADLGQTSTIPQAISEENNITTQFESINDIPTNPTLAAPRILYEDVPATPVRDRIISSPELSPLTPVSETPHPLKSIGIPDNSKEHNETVEPGISELASSPRHPPSPIHFNEKKATSATGHRLLTVTGRGPSNSSGSDVFSVMMRASQANKKGSVGSSQDKGKQKASTTTRSSSSVRDSFRTKIHGEIWKETHPEVAGTKNKLKARMRPREKPKIDPMPILTVPEEEEADEETAPEQPEVDLRDPTPLILPVEYPPAVLVEPSTFGASRELKVPPSRRDEGKQQSATMMSGEFPQSLTSLEEEPPQPSPQPYHSEIPPVVEYDDLAEAERPKGQPYAVTRDAPFGESSEMICDQHDRQTESSPIQARGFSLEVATGSTVPAPEITPKINKSRLPRKKVPMIVPVGRMTRSAASRLKVKDPANSRSATPSNIPVTPRAIRVKSTSISISSLLGKPEQATTVPPPRSELPKIGTTNASALPRTPSQPSTPSRKSIGLNYAKPTTSSAAKVTKTPKLSRSSPAKLTRSPSMPTSRLPNTSSRLFPMTSAGHWASGASSSLSTLSNALEKLRMPPPPRPNTTLGFNRVPDDSDASTSATQDLPSSDRSILGKGLPPSSANLRRRSSSVTVPSSSSTTALKPQSAGQQPLSMFFPSKQDSTPKDADVFAPSGTKPSIRRKLFGVGSGGIFGTGIRSRAPKVSRKTSLPMVVGSPVKGGELTSTNDGDDDDAIVIDDGDDGDKDCPLEIVTDGIPDTIGLGADEYLVPIAGDSPKGARKKDKDGSSSWEQSSRRASLASLALSESLSALPPKGLMGPPSTIPKHGRVTRSTSNNHASTSQTTSPPNKAGDVSGAIPKLQTKASGANVSLGFMKDCAVFVDVRTDDGDDAGSLFSEMLEGAGAKVLSRVGQSCTHIIFKNGLLSTLSRYRTLHDPKPLVVGIAWVVECVEQRKHVDEAKFLVDLADMNFANANKRRKSLLPKLVPHETGNTNVHDINHGHEDGDQSMDGSNSSLILDDLPPLERARRRKSFLVGTRP